LSIGIGVGGVEGQRFFGVAGGDEELSLLGVRFGDTDIAARRLKVLAEVFAESTRAFLLDTVISKPRLALDLGCGPGYSTHFLADGLQCNHTAGLDKNNRQPGILAYCQLFFFGTKFISFLEKFSLWQRF